jgi:hypothetical protein
MWHVWENIGLRPFGSLGVDGRIILKRMLTKRNRWHDDVSAAFKLLVE